MCLTENKRTPVAASTEGWNALSSTRCQKNAALPSDICAFGDSSGIALRTRRSTLHSAHQDEAVFANLRMVIVFLFLVPALALHWSAKKI
jgi:hypothetical protein